MAVPLPGRNRIRDLVAAAVTQLQFSVDTDAEGDGDDTVAPSGGTTVTKAATTTVSDSTVTVTASIAGADVAGDGESFFSVSIATPAGILTRTLRTQPIGVEPQDDSYEVQQDLIFSEAS